jgi:hypothetical protein
MEICYELKEYHGSKLAWGIFFFYWVSKKEENSENGSEKGWVQEE